MCNLFHVRTRPVENFYWNVIYLYRRFVAFSITCHYTCVYVIFVSLKLIVVAHWCFMRSVHAKRVRLRTVAETAWTHSALIHLRYL